VVTFSLSLSFSLSMVSFLTTKALSSNKIIFTDSRG
jgi:hypothetical protein